MSIGKNNNPVSDFKSRFTIRGTLRWLIGGGEYRPIFIIVSFVLFFLIINMPTPESLENILTQPNPQGYATQQGDSIVDHLSEEFRNPDLTVENVAREVKVTLGILAIAAILWGTVAIPIGATGLLIAAIIMYFMSCLLI